MEFDVYDCPCPLCDRPGAVSMYRDGRRHFLQCSHCALVFVPPAERPGAAAEKARYDLHQNDPDDAGYRKFLSRLVDAVLERVPVGAEGLDFGSGPRPVLAQMLTDAGRKAAIYDLFYAPDASVWSRKYDFITACEVLEHLHRPVAELDRLFAALRPGGLLAVMTSFAPGMPDFGKWHYISDFTHVCFFSPRVFEYIAGHWEAEIISIGENVVLMQAG